MIKVLFFIGILVIIVSVVLAIVAVIAHAWVAFIVNCLNTCTWTIISMMCWTMWHDK
jgi:hypothetical protein